MSESLPGKITVQEGVVVTLDYVLRVEGELIDQSADTGAIAFLQGYGQIVPGLEQALYGMAIGDSKQVLVAPTDGYGEVDQEDFAEIPRSEFPSEVPLQEGVELQLRDQDGDVFDAFIEEVRPDTVLLNFNHPLAGKELNFQVTVVDLRPATEEELDHGHVHDGHGHIGHEHGGHEHGGHDQD
jgi:FKBP-type peptidyl-prolyl cis-trans isomerase SlyD